MSIYRTRKSKNQKKWTEWRVKRGTLPKLSTCLSQLKGRPFGEKKQIFEKSLNAEKLKGGPFGFFQHPFCRKTAKKLKGDRLGKKILRKSLAVPKKIERGTLWSRPVWYVTRKNRKNLFG